MDKMKQNINILLSNPNHLISELDLEKVCYEYIASDNDSDFFKDQQGKIYEIKDEFDELEESDNTVKSLYFVIGINGLGEIAELARRNNKASVFIVYEPQGEFFGHVLHNKDLALFADPRMVLIVRNIMEMKAGLRDILKANPYFVSLYGNLRFYATYFYRHYRLDIFREFVKLISEQITALMRLHGNDLEDSLRGFRQNAINGQYLSRSKDVSRLSSYFAGKPAFVVAAGPSLEKNIQELKKAKGHGLIFAVDTIAVRLIEAGIVPDFICTIERDAVIYDFFYRERNIPPEVSLVAPLVLIPAVFENFAGDFIIPFRYVREYFWWNKIYGFSEEIFVEQGLSGAHLAFGMAEKMGCSPIIFVGQDLAYGEKEGETHAGGTVYEELNRDLYEEEGVRHLKTEGYYGGTIETNQLWYDFRLWFESQITRTGILAINSTEGGAKIAGTVEMPLQDAISKYCQNEIDVQALLQQCPYYVLDKKELHFRLNKEVEKLECDKNTLKIHLEKLQAIKIEKQASEKKLLQVLKRMKKSAPLVQSIIDEQFLLGHLMQPELSVMMIAVGRIKQELTYDSIAVNLHVQVRFFAIALAMLEAALQVLKENCQWLEGPVEGEKSTI